MRVYLKKYRNAIVYALTIVFSLVYIILGNRIASRNFYFGSVSTLEYSARVLRVVDIQEENYTLSGTDNQITNEIITFEAMVTSGSLKGITVTATQQRDSIIAVMPERVEAGDEIVLTYASDSELDEDGNVVENGNYIWTFSNYNRLPALLWIGALFFLLLILFGKKKGINTIVSLIFTCLAIFVVFVPSILSGYNIYASSVITCIFIIVVTLLIVVGITRKGVCAAVGCAGGIAAAAIFTVAMSKILQLTGLTDEQLVHSGRALWDILKDCLTFIGSDPLVLYHAAFDYGFLQAGCKKVGLPIPRNQCIDTLKLARQKLARLNSYSLEAVSAYLGLDVTGCHRAQKDCELTLGIYQKLNGK